MLSFQSFNRKRRIVVAGSLLTVIVVVAVLVVLNRREDSALVWDELSTETQIAFKVAHDRYLDGSFEDDADALSEAVELFDDLINVDILYWESYKFKAMAQRELGRHRKAGDTFRDALDHLRFAKRNYSDRRARPVDTYRDSEAFLLKSIAEAAFNDGDYLTAFQMLEEALNTPFGDGDWHADERAEILMMQAKAMLKLNPVAIAQKRLGQARTVAVTHSIKAECYIVSGIVNNQIGQHEEAESNFETAAGLDPSVRAVEVANLFE